MPKLNSIVDRVGNLAPFTEASPEFVGSGIGAAPMAAVTFEGGRTGLLSLSVRQSAVWAEVLRSLQEAGEPAYVEIDPASNVITQLLLPMVVRVGAFTPSAEGDAVEVELIISHARHVLRRSNPDFETLLEALQDAHQQGTTVLVTETPGDHEIIDVRPAPNRRAYEMPAEAPPLEAQPQMAAISPSRAQELFSVVNSKICCPASVPPPCIPFLYPDDGCWGRAHEMCRLIGAAGAESAKVWIYGSLRVSTQNHPACQVRWGWHVAPTVQVSAGGGIETRVIDPSLFPAGPVTQAAWAGVQGDPSAILETSAATVFYRTRGGGYVQYDPSYTETQKVLARYRNELKLRSASSDGPPPYFACMSRPPGVQWFGTIAPRASQSWFTWGWPAQWHVFWTIMPITPCPGAPQLSWTVQVERANASQCTYWIRVTNLTADPVKFEGRYDILSR